MNKVLLLGTLCSGWLAVAAENALTVRVRPTRGGPQIHVDGKPFAPRFFWGAMNGGNLRLGEEWADRTYRCTFRAKASPVRAIQPALYQVANRTWINIGGPPGPFLSQVALALAARCSAGTTHVWCWAPGFTEANAPVWAAEGYWAIQAHAPGPITADVGQAVPVFDALDNQPLGHGPRVRVPFNQGETRLLRY